jgi:hypothetical protein
MPRVERIDDLAVLRSELGVARISLEKRGPVDRARLPDA